MTVHTLFLNMAQTADVLDPPPERDNTKPHVSQLIELASQVAGQKPRLAHSDANETAVAMMSLGRLWELIARPLAVKLGAASYLTFQQSQIRELDGVIGSLDGLLWSHYDDPLSVVEFKCRFSGPSDPTENWRWMVQVKAYCKMVSCNKAWILVLYLPRGEPKPVIAVHMLEFDQLTLDENWQMLLNVKESLWKPAH